jgi:hypothetical protein
LKPASRSRHADASHRADQGLDLRRVHIHAAGDDHVFLAIDDADESLAVTHRGKEPLISGLLLREAAACEA